MKQVDFFKIVALEERGGLCPHTSTKWQTGDGYALGVCQLKQAVKDARDGKDIDLPEELYEVFCSIQNQAIEEAKKQGAIDWIEGHRAKATVYVTFDTTGVEECVLIKESDLKELKEGGE